MNRRLIVGVASLGLLVASAAFGQEKIPRSVIASGGTLASAGSLGIQGTVGQSIIGRTTSSSSAGWLGFWHVLTPYSPSGIRDDAGAVTGLASATMQVVPQPVVSGASIVLNVPSGSIVSLRLYDAVGRSRQTLLANDRFDGRPVQLASDQLESGAYTLVLTLDGRQITTKVQVAH
jgi:hypothetical protein